MRIIYQEEIEGWDVHLQVHENIHNFSRNTEGKKPLGKSRRRWQHSNEMDLTETGFETVKWIRLAHDMDHRWAVVNTVMHLRTEQKREISSSNKRLPASQDRRFPMELDK
jgi:hypothetical protein